jgi:amino acid adenylation domain-containing protein
LDKTHSLAKFIDSLQGYALDSLVIMQLSISQSSPQKLQGPDLLHQLVQSNGIQNAIDYLASNGKRHILSYQDLHNASNHLSVEICGILSDRKSSTQPIIAIMLSQSVELYIAELAVLKSGGAFCCIPTGVPVERLKFILDDISCSLVLLHANQRQMEGLSDYKQHVITIALDTSTRSSYHQAFNPSSSDLAYVMYTSGSTGTPKGVGVSHGAVTQSLLAHDDELPEFSRFLQFSSPAFDVSVFEIFFTLFRGRTLVACERNTMLENLVGVMNDLEVDAAELTPTVAASLLRRKDSVPKLRLLLTIGEMLIESVIKEFGTQGDETGILYAMYGPTECAIHCTLQPAMLSTSAVNDIGRPLRTSQAFIISPTPTSNEFDILPIGSVGELAIGGYQLANGYLNRQEQTLEVFLNNSKWGKLYRTGDKARMLPDGSIECLGRISHNQVKVRGQRVELSEIEQTALGVQGCKVAVAAVIRNILVLFCNLEHGIDVDAIKTECEKWLPIHMLPNDIILLEKLPYLASGKIDRKTLELNYENSLNFEVGGINHNDSMPLDDEKQQKPLDTYEWTELEWKIRNCVSAIAQVPETEVRPHITIFKYGIDSIAAIHLAKMLTSELKLQSKLVASDVLQNPTVHKIAVFIAQKQSMRLDRVQEFDFATYQANYLPAIVQELGIQSNEVDSLQPCTPIQSGMLARFIQSQESYANCLTYRYKTSINVESMRSTILQTLQRHPVFRTGFVTMSEGLFDYSMITYTELDTSKVENFVGLSPDANSIFNWHKQAIACFHRRIQDPPWKILIAKYEDSVTISISLFHGLYDARSIRLLLIEFSSVFARKPLPSILSFTSALGDILTSSKSDEAAEFWKTNLVDGLIGHQLTHKFPNLTLFRQTPFKEKGVLKKTCSLDMKTIEARCAAAEISLLAAGQATWARILAVYLSEPVVAFGLLLSGRDAVTNGEELMFPTLVTVPCAFRDGQDTRRILNDVMNFNANVRRYQFSSLSDIAKWTGRPNEGLFDTIFSLQKFDETEVAPNWKLESELAFDEVR